MRNKDQCPRTLEEAFGPGAKLSPETQPMGFKDRLVVWASLIALLALLLIVINPGGVFNGDI